MRASMPVFLLRWQMRLHLRRMEVVAVGGVGRTHQPAYVVGSHL